jgi:hypothetical protein
MPKATDVFNKVTPDLAAVYYPLCSGLLMWLVFVERILGRLGEERKKVRNRNTDLGRISGYMFIRNDGNTSTGQE